MEEQPMSLRSSPGSQLKQVQHRFDLWRKTRKRRFPIPEALWASAAELARQDGLNRTARALRLNYYALKKRLPRVDGPPRESRRQASFIELLAPGAVDRSTCLIELENAQGGKMKIHLPSLGPTELAVLSDRFWKAAP